VSVAHFEEDFVSNLNKLMERGLRSSLETRDPFAAMDRLMANFFGNAPGREWSKDLEKAAADAYFPSLDMREGDGEVTVTAELPGVDEKDIFVTVNPDSITIKGEKKFEKKGGEKDRWYVERSYGSFQRTLPLPCEVDRERTEASFKKGVLEVHMPKSSVAKSQARHVPIKS
jgi:HSP20 family protein